MGGQHDDTGKTGRRHPKDTVDEFHRLWLRLTGEPCVSIPAWLSRVHPCDVTRVREAWDRARKTGRLDIEYRLRDRHGRYVRVHGVARQWEHPNGEKEWRAVMRVLPAGDHGHICLPGVCYCRDQGRPLPS